MRLSYVLFFAVIVASGCGGGPPAKNEEIKLSESASPSQAHPIEFGDQDWPIWRGTDQAGIVNSGDVPTSWSEDEQVAWKQEVPGRGHSSPIVVGDRIFLTTAKEPQRIQSLLCIDKKTGELLWERDVNSGGFPKKHVKNSFASGTPASDGHLVFTAFVNHDRVQVTAYDFAGKKVWETNAGAFKSEHGFGSSPTLFENYVIVAGDGAGGGFLAALDRASGKIAWRVSRESAHQSGNYSTPVIANLAGKPQLILPGYFKTVSYDPRTGQEFWHAQGPAVVTANSVAISDPYVIVTGGFPEKKTMCIKADGSGDVTDSHVIWESTRSKAYVPSPVIDGDSVLILTDDGVLASVNIESGKQNWVERLGGNFSATPVRVGNRFIVPDEAGTMFVFETDPEFKLLAKNQLADDGGMASVAVSGNSLFIRTDHSLYRIDGDAGSTDVARNSLDQN